MIFPLHGFEQPGKFKFTAICDFQIVFSFVMEFSVETCVTLTGSFEITTVDWYYVCAAKSTPGSCGSANDRDTHWISYFLVDRILYPEIPGRAHSKPVPEGRPHCSQVINYYTYVIRIDNSMNLSLNQTEIVPTVILSYLHSCSICWIWNFLS